MYMWVSVFKMSLKIYFCGSIRAGRDDAPLYVRIIDHLKTYGTVLTEHVGNPNVVKNGQFPIYISYIYKWSHNMYVLYIYRTL